MNFTGIINLRNEEWKQIIFNEEDDILSSENYFISNYGRLIKFKEETPVLVKAYFLNGYPHIKVKTNTTTIYRGYKKRKYKGYYLHKLVATFFLEPLENQTFVIHLDYNKLNNEISNLKWATKREKEIHQSKNPIFIKALKNRSRDYAKLTENNVRLIKKMLNNPNRKTRLRIIAKQFGVSTMQLQRIKTGENWSDIPSL
ncbi:HNH endonuclease [Winogradskyella litorisediminis]|uniref:HNH endonuclease n=1 Tax=Winogradskyella litorisediminis TaxID=1156618 RepID=A0ABW3N8H2_9FLAO